MFILESICMLKSQYFNHLGWMHSLSLPGIQWEVTILAKSTLNDRNYVLFDSNYFFCPPLLMLCLPFTHKYFETAHVFFPLSFCQSPELRALMFYLESDEIALSIWWSLLWSVDPLCFHMCPSWYFFILSPSFLIFLSVGLPINHHCHLLLLFNHYNIWVSGLTFCAAMIRTLLAAGSTHVRAFEP